MSVKLDKAQFQHFVYGVYVQIYGKEGFLRDEIFASDYDAQQFVTDEILPSLKPGFVAEYNQDYDYWDIFDQRGKEFAYVAIRSFSYYE